MALIRTVHANARMYARTDAMRKAKLANVLQAAWTDAIPPARHAPVKRAVSQVHHVMKTPANAHALKHVNLAVMQLVTATKHVQISNVKVSTSNA